MPDEPLASTASSVNFPELKTIFDAAGAMIVATDADGIVRVFNRTAERLLGWRADEVVGKQSPAIWHVPEEVASRAAELSRRLGRTIQPGQDYFQASCLEDSGQPKEWTLIRKDGSTFPVQLSVSALRDSAGRTTGYVGTAQDLTDRVRAEQERDRLFEVSLDILCIANEDGYFKRINPAFSQTLGWSETEILARPFIDFVHPDDRTATLSEVEKQVIVGEKVLHFENRYQHKDGSWRVLSWRSVPQPGGLMFATARDVTDAKRAEIALRLSEQNLAITLDSIGDAVIATDAVRRITRMNPIAEQMTGWTQADAVGRPVNEVFHIINEETRCPAVIPVDDVLISGTIKGLANHTVLISRDGTEWVIADTAAPIRDDAGRIIGVVLVFRDVAEERRFARELQRLNAGLELRVEERTAELTESERFNRATLNALSAHVAVLDATGMIVATNLAWQGFAQANDTSWQTVGEGTNYLAICDRAAAAGDADAAGAARAIRQVLAGERETWLHEYPCHSADKQRWFYCRVTRFPEEGAVHVVVMHENITVMKQTQRELAAAHARFETLDRVSPVGILFFDSVGSCLDVNDRWCEISGISREAARGDGWHSVVHPEDRAQVSHEWRQATRAGESFRSEIRSQRPNGEILWLFSQAVPTRDERGIVNGFIRACIDITEQKQTEQVLRLLSTDLAGLRGAEFFDAVVGQLVEMLNCEMAFICLRDPSQPDQLITLAIFADGKLQPNFSYSIAGTPCEHVVDRRSCIIPSNVQQKYPLDVFLIDHQIEAYVGVPFIDGLGRQIGHIGVMSRQPMTHSERVEAIIKLFAVSVVAEMSRQVSERRFSDLFEFSPDAIVITNRDGLIVQANRQVATVFGWTPAELVGQLVEVLMPADLRAGHPRLRERYVQSVLPRAMGCGRNDLLGLRKDGTAFPVEISLSPMQTSEGLLVAAAVRDVTDRQKVLRELQTVAEELQEAKAFAVTVIESVSGLFYVLDQDGNFVRWNQSMQDLLGLSSDQMQRTNALSIIHEADRERIAEKIAEVFTNGHAEAAEARLLFKQGARHFLLNGRRLIINDVVYLVGSGADITDRKQSEEDILSLNHTLEQRVRDRTAELTAANEKLIQASRFKSEFLATMSHELRTPLNGVLGMNELLLKTPLTDKQREFVDASSTSGRALLSLVNDVLDISKIEAGKIELDIHGCDLEAMAFDIVTMFSHQAKQKGISLSCRLDPETCASVMCDDTRLRQILVNLLGNALKFTATGSVILESKCVQRDDRRIVVRLAVTDTGLGIPDDKLNRLFSPFSQVDSSTTRHYGGTGLGLSITKQLVELMGGTIGVTSRLGVGSTFWIEISFELVNAEVRTFQRKQLLNGIKVLAVDGVDKERRQIADCLEAWGCPFEHVSTLREAVDAVAQAEAAGQPFAVVLADCRLAIGDEFVHLQSLARRPGLPVIGLGIGEGNDLATHLRQLGLRHLLRDPVRPSTLFNALTSVLSVSPPAVSPEGRRPDAAVEKSPTTFSGHILVAEDNSINQMFVRELLKHCGCTCDIANNGDEALTALQQKRYDLALMDCQMPEMDGFTASREIRRREAAGELTGRLPIIALTANALKGDRERCLEAGMDDYLTKPLQAAQLQTMLAKHIAARSAMPAP